MIDLQNELHYRESTERTLEYLESKCSELLPNAKIEHIGSSAIPGALTKGDVDILIMVKEEEFDVARGQLDSLFSHNPGMPPEKDFVSYSGKYRDTDFGIQLLSKNDEKFRFLKLKNALSNSPDLLSQYNNLKIKYSNRPIDEYRKAKADFIHEIVGDT